MAASYTMRSMQVNLPGASFLRACLRAGLIAAVLALAACADRDAAVQPAESSGPMDGADAALDEATLLLRDRALTALRQDQPDEAEPLLRQLQQERPGDPLPATNLAISLLLQQRADEAAAVLASLPKAPAPARLLAVRAAIAQLQGRTEASLADLRAALAAAPEDAELRSFAIDLLDAQDSADVDTAALRQATLAQWLTLRPDEPVARLLALRQALQDANRSAATGHYLRLRELLGRPDRTTARILAAIGDGLSAAELDTLPAEAADLLAHLRGTTPSALSRMAVTIDRFEGEAAFNARRSIELQFEARLIDAAAGVPGALAAGDLDGDGRPDLFRIRAATDSAPAVLELRLASAEYNSPDEHPIDERGVEVGSQLLLSDVSNDGVIDLLVFGADGGAAFQGAFGGRLLRVPNDIGLDQAGAVAAESLDADRDGDLDLVLLHASENPLSLHRNNLIDALQPQDPEAFGTGEALAQPLALASTDLDRDGRMDLLIAHGDGLRVLKGNRRARWEQAAELALPGISATAAADLDNDGWVDLLLARGDRLEWLRNDEGELSAPAAIELDADIGSIGTLRIGDFDNDGRKDLAVGGERGLAVAQQIEDGGYRSLGLEETETVLALASVDVDGDGRLDLLVSTAAGLTLWQNRTASRHDWLALRLRGLAQASSRNNRQGIGSRVEVRRGDSVQVVDVQSGLNHLGLGSQDGPLQIRVHWPDGSIEQRSVSAGAVEVVERREIDEGGPQLYGWDGDDWVYAGELLLSAKAGEAADSVRHDLAPIRQLSERDGRFELQLGAEYRHAVELAQLRLWIVDQPADVVLSSWPQPGAQSGTPALRGVRELQQVTTALDGRSIEVAERLRTVDLILADGYQPSAWPGIARGPWSLSLDLGQTPGAPLRLWLDGWMMPTGSVTDLALSQRSDFSHLPLRIEVEVGADWQPLLADAGVPPVSPRSLAIDLPGLPAGAQRIRLMSNRAMHWDRIAWTTQSVDQAHTVVAQRLPMSAELSPRGYARRHRPAPNAAQIFDPTQLSTKAPWRLPPIESGAHGDVLASFAGRSSEPLVMAPGDGLELSFDASELPPLAEGQVRSYWLESRGRRLVGFN